MSDIALFLHLNLLTSKKNVNCIIFVVRCFLG